MKGPHGSVAVRAWLSTSAPACLVGLDRRSHWLRYCQAHPRHGGNGTQTSHSSILLHGTMENFTHLLNVTLTLAGILCRLGGASRCLMPCCSLDPRPELQDLLDEIWIFKIGQYLLVVPAQRRTCTVV